MKMAIARRSKGEERREAIEAAARRMLLDEGYTGISLRQIATKLGISVGNLQYYFPTKDDLVESVIIGETQKPIDMLGEITWDPNNTTKSIRQAVGSLMQYYASEAGRFYAIMESLALYDARYVKLKADGYAHVLSHIEKLISLVAPELPAGRASGLARVLVALIDGASLQVQFARGDDGSVRSLIVDVSAAIEHLLENWE
ncbi:hypothetical protein GCM10009096_21480 [Parasphingorhabdus litoris]|uniref:HTH tetR-type domain-containing protein n=1 Tax=Parasphingorhabdus litoris TaxID=394733 RepID=A0ABN1AKZ3_9SPHN|nr:TetR/AcrR family transcriptional regulator [Parasphingorhabdus litoris]